MSDVPDPDAVHVLPVNDLIDHEDIGDDCPCGPKVEPVKRDDGSVGWVIVHNSLDNREANEGVVDPFAEFQALIWAKVVAALTPLVEWLARHLPGGKT